MRIHLALATAILLCGCGSASEGVGTTDEAATAGKGYCADLRDALTAAQAREAHDVSELTALRSQKADLISQIRDVEARISGLEVTMAEVDQYIAELRKKLPLSFLALKAAKDYRARLQAQYEDLAAQADAVGQQLADVQRQISERVQEGQDLFDQIRTMQTELAQQCSVTVIPH